MAEAERVAQLVHGGAENIGLRQRADFLPTVSMVVLNVTGRSAAGRWIVSLRFGDRLQVEWTLDPAAGPARLPPLLLQPLVENAVQHGVEPSHEGAQIRITTQRRGARVVVKVTNTVPAGPGRRGHGVALENVRDRLGLLHDVQAQFQTVCKDGLYQVRIEVPA